MAGLARRGDAGLGVAWFGKPGEARLVRDWLGQARHGEVWQAGLGRRGLARSGRAWRGLARRGRAWQAWPGTAGQGAARRGFLINHEDG